MSYLASTIKQTLELKNPSYEKGEKHEVDYSNFLTKSAPTNRKSLTTENPYLGYVDSNFVYRPSPFNNLTDVAGVQKVAICRNDLKLKIVQSPQPTYECKPVDIGRYDNVDAKPILQPPNPFFFNQGNIAPVY